MSSDERQVAKCLSKRKNVPVSKSDLASKTSTKAKADSTTQPTKPKQKRRREKNLDPCPPETPLPPCRVCDEIASGYHYGVNSCEACKAFYKRTLKKVEVNYKCKCTPDEAAAWKTGPQSNGCPSCRYERCLTVGMSRNAMKIGRYTLEHKSENIREVTKARVEDSETIATPSRSSSNLTDMEQPAPQPSSPISIEDIIIKSFSFALSPDNLYDDDLQISDTEESCVNNFMIQGTDLAGTDTSGLESKPGPSLKEMEQIVKILTKANKETSEELAISQEEIQRVHTSVLENYQLKSQVFGLMKPISIQEYLEFYKSTGIDVDGRGEELITAILHFQKKIVKSVKFAKTIPGFRQLCPDDQASLLKASRVDIDIICTYKYMYHCHNVERQVIITPWGGKYHIDELEKVFPRDLVLGRNKAVRSLYELGLSEHEEAVVKAFVVMSPDRCELREPEKVQESQDKLLSCLRHLFNIRPGGTGTRLYKLFDILTYFRSLFERETEFVKTVKVHAPDYLYDDKFALIREFVL